MNLPKEAFIIVATPFYLTKVVSKFLGDVIVRLDSLGLLIHDCIISDFEQTEDGFQGRIEAARAFLILSHLVALPMIAACVAVIFIEEKIKPIIVVLLTSVYS